MARRLISALPVCVTGIIIDIEPAIRRHRKPHVVRVSAERIQTPSENVLLVSSGSNLCVDLDVIVGSSITVPTFYVHKNEHFTCCRWDYTGYGK